ncbi:hypothetical protein PF005_g2436 [Phytophthora fragariae]|uniref:Uncharacterized protein n=1 Tax=Phytophthora fragariae TaxID=53985 RepID=A0A6A3ZAV1_9STRA|nr:hypothetical protein PF003_g8528 [Phytophthora fragariae]KAE8946074.1 hypothetical protein PF009_g4296 [Phytophthora fragariae]KAE9025111.1 hypothetical protein PF011_g3187 [Phytophthora fragariae]KAE9135618.1 hypothetical protein PF010_g2018 [Phytophthora fragariae]KAE9135935.1 hypothetical protein PF007_g2381 [Phytophthora fragariae]
MLFSFVTLFSVGVLISAGMFLSPLPRFPVTAAPPPSSRSHDCHACATASVFLRSSNKSDA